MKTAKAQMYGNGDNYIKPLQPTGVIVRIRKRRSVFEERYTLKWSYENFTVFLRQRFAVLQNDAFIWLNI